MTPALPDTHFMRGTPIFSQRSSASFLIASDAARFGTAFARVGYSGDFGGSYFLTRIVGPAKARELYFSAEMIGAEEALRLGS
jgi:2-(1,2-epoxy-1,2-dihydrophenyl)acetyl-CoA isomerase